MRSSEMLLASSSRFCAAALLAGAVHAQASGPLWVSQNNVFALGNAPPSLSLDGNELVARETGPYFDSSPTGVHVFVRSAGVWSQQQLLTAPNCISWGTVNGMNVSLRGTRLVVGVSNGVEGGGDVRISEFSGGSWAPFTIVPNPTDLNNFSSSVLERENVVLVGKPDTSMSAGGVIVFRNNGTAWIVAGGFGPPLGSSGVYGTALADSGNTLLVASKDKVDVRVRGATAVDWVHQALLDPVGTALPVTIAIDGDVAVVSSYSNAWHAEVFERSGTTWSLTATLTGDDSVPSDAFGSSVGVHGQTIYVGAQGASSNQGAVYVFQHLAGAWTQTAKLAPDVPVAGGRFGATLVVDGATLAVGAATSSPTPPAAGAVYLFDVTPLPPAQTYCTAKINSQGCLPQIFASGIPGATHLDAFVIGASNVLNQKTGMLLYSIAGSATTPFQGGTLCIAAPLHRTPAQNSGGFTGPDDCSGSYSFDFNARVQSGVDPALVPGVAVWAQYYSRDPVDPFGVGLTDAVVFTIGS